MLYNMIQLQVTRYYPCIELSTRNAKKKATIFCYDLLSKHLSNI